jgi:hypothetical protein
MGAKQAEVRALVTLTSDSDNLKGRRVVMLAPRLFKCSPTRIRWMPRSSTHQPIGRFKVAARSRRVTLVRGQSDACSRPSIQAKRSSCCETTRRGAGRIDAKCIIRAGLRYVHERPDRSGCRYSAGRKPGVDAGLSCPVALLSNTPPATMRRQSCLVLGTISACTLRDLRTPVGKQRGITCTKPCTKSGLRVPL